MNDWRWMMRVVVCSATLLVLVAGLWWTVGFNVAVQAQGNDPNVVMLDNCSHTDPGIARLSVESSGSRVITLRRLPSFNNLRLGRS
jgi:hypothetical protein